MESSIVNARIPRAKKEAASEVLSSIGSSTSELINTAYDYVLEHKRLPNVSSSKSVSTKGFSEFVSKSTIDIDWGQDPESVDYKDILRNGKRVEYESLA